MRSRDELRDAMSPASARAFGAIRRMAITLTQNVLWQLTGIRSLDGTTETRQVENFSGIGFFARPSSSGSPEAIAVNVGDADSPAIVATRDEKTRAASAGDLAPDETAMFNSLARAHVKADGTIELKTIAGNAEKMMKGETYRTAEDVLLTALTTFATGLGTFATAMHGDAALDLVAPITVTAAGVMAGLCANMVTAIATFKTAAPTYLATVGKVE